MKIFTALFAAFITVSGASALERPTPLGRNAVSVPSNGITVTVDPRIELMLTLELLSGFERIAPFLTEYNFLYKRFLLYYFRDYDTHSAVETLNRLGREGLTRTAPLEIMLHLTSPPALSTAIPLTPEIMEKAGGNRGFSRLVNDMRRFANDTSFMYRYSQNADMFLRLVTEVFYATQESDLVQPLERYTGTRQKSYTFILAPLFHDGASGIGVGNPDSMDVYCVFGTRDLNLDGEPVFGDSALFREAAWHAFGHAVVDALTVRNREAVDRHRALFDPLAKKLRYSGVTSWEECVNEHLARAVMIRLYTREVSAEEGARRLTESREAGYAYIDAILDRLGEYELNRDKYPSLAEFYPRIIDLFGEMEGTPRPVGK